MAGNQKRRRRKNIIRFTCIHCRALHFLYPFVWVKLYFGGKKKKQLFFLLLQCLVVLFLSLVRSNVSESSKHSIARRRWMNFSNMINMQTKRSDAIFLFVFVCCPFFTYKLEFYPHNSSCVKGNILRLLSWYFHAKLVI